MLMWVRVRVRVMTVCSNHDIVVREEGPHVYVGGLTVEILACIFQNVA